jgi:hypothetical protein
MTTMLTKVILTGIGFSLAETKASTTAQIADNKTTKTTDNMLNCWDNHTPLHTRFRIKRKRSKT